MRRRKATRRKPQAGRDSGTFAKREPITPAETLVAIPNGLREPLLEAFAEIVRNFRENRWEPAELNGGKLCEVIYTILLGFTQGGYANTPTKPKNMVDACRELEKADQSQFPRSIRVQIPRVLLALYEVRNNRGVGHVGGDVNPNHMDAMLVTSMSKWLVAELVRLFHKVSVAEATAVSDALVDRSVPVVWMVRDRRRILAKGLTMRDKMLLLLYSSSIPLAESQLIKWLEHSNPSVVRRDVLRPCHRLGLIDYDPISHEVTLSPTGIIEVEKTLPLSLGALPRTLQS